MLPFLTIFSPATSLEPMNRLVVLQRLQVAQVVPPLAQKLLTDDLEPRCHVRVKLGECSTEGGERKKGNVTHNYDNKGLMVTKNNLSDVNYLHLKKNNYFRVRTTIKEVLLSSY